jgi:hypothetical protein
LEDGTGIMAIQKLLDHESIETTIIYQTIRKTTIESSRTVVGEVAMRPAIEVATMLSRHWEVVNSS